MSDTNDVSDPGDNVNAPVLLPRPEARRLYKQLGKALEASRDIEDVLLENQEMMASIAGSLKDRFHETE